MDYRHWITLLSPREGERNGGVSKQNELNDFFGLRLKEFKLRSGGFTGLLVFKCLLRAVAITNPLERVED